MENMAETVEKVRSLVGTVIEIGNYVVPPLKRHFDYLCCLDSNIQIMKDQARILEDERNWFRRTVDEAENNAEVIAPEVTAWFEKVRNKIQVDMRGINNEISNVQSRFWDIKSRYQLNREVVKIIGEMKELVEERNNFNRIRISVPPPPAAHVPIPLGATYLEFQSRKQIEEEIVEALKANGIRTVGICGMGGVGKTTTAKRIMNRVRDADIFQEIPVAVVSQQVDMLKIQDEIAESLGLKFEDKTLAAKANKLRARLTGSNDKRILVLLDDVWEKLKLDDLGIPCGNDWCTILFTSRNRDVLHKMDVQKVCAMEVLSNDDAWGLFRDKAGICEDDSNLFSIAQRVAKECKGLPIALITVGGALKGQTIITYWKGALDELKSSNPEYMPDFIKDVYNPLKLSYTYLEKHERSLFLLCSLFPEDANISLEDVLLYCIGLSMFCNSNFSSTFEETLAIVRTRITRTVETLKNRFLLLKGRDKHHVRMHDVVRDVAIYIAKNEAKEEGVDVKFNSWHSSREYTYQQVSVISEKLSTLIRLHGLLDEDKRFEIMDSSLLGELNVLSFEYVSLESLPVEMHLLKNLRTLRLESCEVESLSFVGELLCLEILYCRYCEDIEELPVEIGKLNQLKLLDFSYCENLGRIPPGVISNLVELEEFKMLGNFGGWESATVVQGKERRNASLNEFEYLRKLTCLEIEIHDFSLAAEEIRFSSNIVHYYIQIGVDENVPYGGGLGSQDECRCISLALEREIKLGRWVLRFIRSSNCLQLRREHGYSDSEEIFDDQSSNSLDHCWKSLEFGNWSIDDESKLDVFPIWNLEYLHLYNLPNLEEILDGEVLDSSNSFNNLRELYLQDMRALKHLCKRPDRSPVSLDKLERITIYGCSNLFKLFSFTMDGQNDNASIDDLLCTQKVHYPKLKCLELSELDKLEVIWDAPISEGSNSFKNIRQLRFSHLSAMTYLWKSSSRNISLRNLSTINVYACDKLHTLFSTTMSMDFVLQLELLQISLCEMMEQVILLDEVNENDANQCRTIQFPKLKELELCRLESLTAFIKGIESIEFPMLFNVIIKNCRKFTSLLPSTENNQDSANDHNNDTFHLFCSEKVILGSLKKIHIEDDDKSNIWCRQIPLGFFSQLEELVIMHCQGIKNLFSSSIAENFVSLKKLEIKWCNEMVKSIEDNEEMLCGKSIILFPNLKELELYDLPKLGSFCNWRCNLQLPLLEKVQILRCPLLEFFSKGSVSTPNLKCINYKQCDSSRIWGDLNSEIQLLFKAEHQLSSTEKGSTSTGNRRGIKRKA